MGEVAVDVEDIDRDPGRGPRNGTRGRHVVTSEQVRTMQTAQPFRPFLVKLADGRHFLVTHPELAACSKNGREMVVYDDDGMHLIEMLLVVELTPQVTPGSSKKRTTAGK